MMPRDLFHIFVCECGVHCSSLDGSRACPPYCWQRHENYVPIAGDRRRCTRCSDRNRHESGYRYAYVHENLGGLDSRHPSRITRHGVPPFENPQVRRTVRHWQRAMDVEMNDAESQETIDRAERDGELLLTQGFTPNRTLAPPPGVRLQTFDRWGRDPNSQTDYDIVERNARESAYTPRDSTSRSYYPPTSSRSTRHEDTTRRSSSRHRNSSSTRTSTSARDPPRSSSRSNRPSTSSRTRASSSTRDTPRPSGLYNSSDYAYTTRDTPRPSGLYNSSDYAHNDYAHDDIPRRASPSPVRSSSRAQRHSTTTSRTRAASSNRDTPRPGGFRDSLRGFFGHSSSSRSSRPSTATATTTARGRSSTAAAPSFRDRLGLDYDSDSGRDDEFDEFDDYEPPSHSHRRR